MGRVELGVSLRRLMKESEVTQSCPTLCDPVDYSPSTRLLRPWDSPGKNTGVGCHFLLQGIFPTQGSNQVSCIAGRCFNLWATREATWYLILLFYLLFAYIVKALNCELLSFLFKDKRALPPSYSPPLHNLKSPAANIWLTCQVGFTFMKTYHGREILALRC